MMTYPQPSARPFAAKLVRQASKEAAENKPRPLARQAVQADP